MSLSLQIYHQLPPWARNVAASLRGYYLSSWRYDSATEKLVEEILERDSWSEARWKTWQEERLAFILHRAATKVPYYREQWATRRRGGDNSSWERLENWDVLEKQTLRERAAEFVAEDCDKSKMYLDHTSGTSGTSLNLWAKAGTVKFWYAMFEARARRWYDVSRKDKWAILGGQMVAPVKQRKPPFWVWNAGLKQLYMSSYHLAPDLLDSYLDALVKYRIEYILGYPSAIYSLAQEALRRNRNDLKMKVVIGNAEPLLDFQRELIGEAFQCPVRETYGMAETVAAASDCQNGKLHQWPDAGVIEAESEELSDFICTGLINADMPLVRYRVGDSGSFSKDKCLCGKNLPVIEKIDGRSDDILYTRDGRKIGRLDPVFKKDFPILEAQIIQNSIEELTVKLVPAENYSEKAASDLIERIKERMGEIEVKLEKVPKVPRTSRGKFRSVICNLSPEEKAKVSTR